MQTVFMTIYLVYLHIEKFDREPKKSHFFIYKIATVDTPFNNFESNFTIFPGPERDKRRELRERRKERERERDSITEYGNI